jgi:hypothetical protein
MTTVLLVEKLGSIKPLKIKEYNEADFYKKCGFKSSANFKKQHTWKSRINGTTYYIDLFAKSDVGHSIGENKYEFPPPVDSVLYFGTCLLTASIIRDGDRTTTEPVSLSVELWNQIYNKLYGGFENLADTAEADANEVDELEHIPPHKKTQEGYLKDGFVVDSKPKKVTGAGGGGGGGGGNPTRTKKTTTSHGPMTSRSRLPIPIPMSSSSITNPATKPIECDEDLLEEDEDETTVYTDIDDDDEDEDEAIVGRGSAGEGELRGGGGGGVSSSRVGSKKKKSASKKKGTQKDLTTTAAAIELTIQELLITDELKEEPYLV